MMLSLEEPLTLHQTWALITHALRPLFGKEARREAQLLLFHSLPCQKQDFLSTASQHCLSFEALDRVQRALKRRMAYEPLSRILGKRAFWKDDFHITPDVLDPRPETELLIEWAQEIFPMTAPGRIVDVGTGSGCIILSLLREFPRALGIGIDYSHDALAVAAHNGISLGLNAQVQWMQGVWLSSLSPRSIDLIVSNPPYIPSKDIMALQPAVHDYDPWLALDGGESGLDAYHALIPQAAACLKLHGVFMCEIGAHQETHLIPLMQTFFPYVTARKDYNGHVRALCGRFKSP